MYSINSISYMDLRSPTNFSEITMCMRANFRSFFPEQWNFLFNMKGTEELKGFEWYFVIFEPFHSMRDMEKQVLRLC